jgi:hypothetical protein
MIFGVDYTCSPPAYNLCGLAGVFIIGPLVSAFAILFIGLLILLLPRDKSKLQLSSGADGGTRTRTGFPLRDFKSLASTISPRPLNRQYVHIHHPELRATGCASG